MKKNTIAYILMGWIANRLSLHKNSRKNQRKQEKNMVKISHVNGYQR